MDNEHVHYLQEKAQVLQPHERHVMLLLDDIYVNPKTTFKGGSISGSAINSPGEEATTVVNPLDQCPYRIHPKNLLID